MAKCQITTLKIISRANFRSCSRRSSRCLEITLKAYLRLMTGCTACYSLRTVSQTRRINAKNLFGSRCMCWWASSRQHSARLSNLDKDNPSLSSMNHSAATAKLMIATISQSSRSLPNLRVQQKRAIHPHQPSTNKCLRNLMALKFSCHFPQRHSQTARNASSLPYAGIWLLTSTSMWTQLRSKKSVGFLETQ